MKQIAIIAVLVVVALFVGTAYAHFGGDRHVNPSKFNTMHNMTSMSEKLGLPANTTMLQIRNILIEKRALEKNDLLQSAKQKLGMSDNATNEELRTAINNWSEQNKDLLALAHGNRMQGFSMAYHRW